MQEHTHIEQHGGALAPELRIAADVAKEAGLIALRYHGKDLQVERKLGGEPVTIADRECSRHIVKRLREAFPQDVIISEENEDDADRLSAERVWYVDPIDGTKDFIRGDSSYCIMLGLAIDHRPTLGVIYQPNHKSLIFACEGQGAWCERDSILEPLATSTVATPGQARLLTSSSSQVDVEQIKATLGVDEARRIGSIGMKIATIAMGASDLYVNPATYCSSWDTCAPQIILQEAGGKLTDLHGRPLSYDTADSLRHQRGMIASNGTMHEAAVRGLAKLFPADS